ncbi:MAG: T9SS type A sorting domain-containing protein [Ignavibacteria bacterium]|nr:T9SS type A sorting domain-containing protein [Ignavibacteria bacterium]
MNNRIIHCLAISGNNPEDSGQDIFAGTENYGVYHTTNSGQNFIQINQGFPEIIDVSSLIIANNYIFAGTLGHFAWRRKLDEITCIQNISTEIPSAYSLEQNYPNPFNPSTKIRFAIPKNEIVTLKIFDLLGREVAVLVNEKLQPGTYETTFDARRGGTSTLTSGVYFYRLEVNEVQITKKCVLLK